MKIIKNTKIKTLTNQITYNRLLRATNKILKENVFELNDDFTRKTILSKLKQLYSKAKTFAIVDYNLEVLPFNSAKPHYIEVNIIIQLPQMVHYVIINLNNVDEY